MVHYSVLIPERDAAEAVGRMLPQLCLAFERLVLPFEIICIDDASTAQGGGTFEGWLDEFAPLRVLRFDRPRGMSAALSAGIAAARGDRIVTLDARSPLCVPTIHQMISRLSQFDLVFARRRHSPGAELLRSLVRVPRLLAAQARPATDELSWAARREAVTGLALAPGAFRALPGLVARRGFRVSCLTLEDGLSPRGTRYAPWLLERLAIGWLDRRFEPHLARELMRGGTVLPRVPLSRGAARPRFVPDRVASPAEAERRESA